MTVRKKIRAQSYIIAVRLDRNHILLQGIANELMKLGICIDKKYGVITIDPRDNLYAIRATGNIENLEQARAKLPQIEEFYYDSPTYAI